MCIIGWIKRRIQSNTTWNDLPLKHCSSLFCSRYNIYTERIALRIISPHTAFARPSPQWLIFSVLESVAHWLILLKWQGTVETKRTVHYFRWPSCGGIKQFVVVKNMIFSLVGKRLYSIILWEPKKGFKDLLKRSRFLHKGILSPLCEIRALYL